MGVLWYLAVFGAIVLGSFGLWLVALIWLDRGKMAYSRILIAGVSVTAALFLLLEVIL